MRELQPEALRRLSKTTFDHFCRRLLDVEYAARFEAETVELDGPAEDDVSDGGRDLWARVTKPALRTSHWTLLPSEASKRKPMEVWYSCKTSKEPGRWRALVRKDLDPSPRIYDEKNGQLFDDAKTRAANKGGPQEALLQVLVDGGRFVVLVNARAQKVKEFRGELRAIFEFWIARVLGTKHRLLESQVRVFDATHLANVFNARKFMLDAPIERELSLEEPNFLLDWGRWTKAYTGGEDEGRGGTHTGGRRAMRWRPDALRNHLIRELREFSSPAMAATTAVLRVWGPPGAGKTRLVHHALDHEDLRDRVRASDDVHSVQDWLADQRSAFAEDLILIVDEVAPSDSASLAHTFGRFAPAGARLILIGPEDLGHQGSPEPRRLAPLEPEQTRLILEDEMGDDPRVEVVLGLCDGYPLFAYWLGRALADDPDLLREPGRSLTDDEDPWDATCAVLMGPRGAQETRWREGATVRAKVLLLASLLHEAPWSRLVHDEKEALAAALGVGWDELRSAMGDCVNRSLLRSRGQSYYVSPANLERMVLNHFFGDRGPGGAPLDPQRFARELPRRFPNLVNRAQLVGASDSCKRNLAGGALEELRESARALVAGDAAPLGERASVLTSVCHVAPRETVELIAELIETLGVDGLTTARATSVVRQALRHASHRELSATSFASIEASLFAFAFARASSSVDPIDSIWAGLFRPGVHLTRQPFGQRLALLHARLRSEVASERELAVAALVAAIDGQTSAGWTPGWDDIDGSWEHERRLDIGPRYAQLWSALLAASADPLASIQARSRRAIALNLRRGLASGLQPEQIDRLGERSIVWTIEERDLLAEHLDDVFRYDIEEGASPDPWLDALERLRQEITPTGLYEEIVAQVGRWHPGPWPVDAQDRETLERELDARLAARLLDEPAVLESAFAWLISPGATRKHRFAEALGRADTARSLYLSLRRQARDARGQLFIAAYLVGWSEAVGPEAFDEWLSSAMLDEPSQLLARVLTWIPSSEWRAGLLLDILRGADVDGLFVSGFGFRRGWASEVSTRRIDELIVEIAGRHEKDFERAGLGLLEVRLSRSVEGMSSELLEASHELLEGQVVAPPSIVQRAWVNSIVALAKHGHLRPLFSVVDEIVDELAYPHHVVSAIRKLMDSPGFADKIWSTFAYLLDDLDQNSTLADVLADAGILAHATPAAILGWIDTDSARGLAVVRILGRSMTKPRWLLHALVSRFGPRGRVTQQLATKIGEDLLGELLDDADRGLHQWASAELARRVSPRSRVSA